jgi:hypothetical protein
LVARENPFFMPVNPAMQELVNQEPVMLGGSVVRANVIGNL